MRDTDTTKHSEIIAKPASGNELTEVPPRHTEFQRIVQVFFRRKLAVIGLVIMILFVLTAIFAPWLTPYDPIDYMELSKSLAAPSWEHPLGLDSAGRDILSRVIYGTRISLIIGIGAVGMAAIIGQALGLIAAYFGGLVFTIIMRCIDALLAVPMVLTALTISVVLGGGIINVIIAISLGIIPIQARLMCGQALTVKQNDYILSERAMGAGALRTMLRHIVPNAFPSLLVMVTIDLGGCILMEATLSFLGVGIAPPLPAWGAMVNNGYPYLLTAPLLSIAPGIAIMLVVFGVNMVGDGLRDALDPRLRGII